jgi:hypothetical protein
MKRSDFLEEIAMNCLIVFGLGAVLAGGALTADADTEATRHELRTVAQYPRPVRKAILEILNQPQLLGKLGDAANLERTLKGQKPAAVDAARVVVQYPPLLQLLKDSPEALAHAAKAYADDKAKVIEQLDQWERDNELAIGEWSQRLEGDQVALEQIQSAATAFTKQPGVSPMDVGLQWASAEATVYRLPTPRFITYVMDNADAYPAVANVMVSQWLTTNNGAAYDRTFYHWWGRYRPYFHDNLLTPDADRFHRLSELARYERRFSSLDASHRFDHFGEHSREFSHLSKHHSVDLKRAPLGIHEKPHHKDPHAPGHDPHKLAHKGGHTKVHHKPPSHQHHMHHALAGHQHHVQHHGGHKK